MAMVSAAQTAPIRYDTAILPHRIVRSAQVLLEQGRYSWIWVVPTCPYCGKAHHHYGGPLDRAPSTYRGQVFPAHCDRTDRCQLGIPDPTAALWYVLTADPQAPGAPPHHAR
jgi:hypothetical protein